MVKIRSVSTEINLHNTALGAYDVIVGMEWLESYQSLVEYFKMKVFCNNYFRELVVIEGIKQDISL